jgi:hypothetical protein
MIIIPFKAYGFINSVGVICLLAVIYENRLMEGVMEMYPTTEAVSGGIGNILSQYLCVCSAGCQKDQAGSKSTFHDGRVRPFFLILECWWHFEDQKERCLIINRMPEALENISFRAVGRHVADGMAVMPQFPLKVILLGLFFSQFFQLLQILGSRSWIS